MKGKKQEITHEDIRQALEKFRGRGGTITRLPDQDNPGPSMVGRKWMAYEHLFGEWTGLSTFESDPSASTGGTELPGSFTPSTVPQPVSR